MNNLEAVGSARLIVWLDCEMTGLAINGEDPTKDDEIVEIGVIVTDGNLVPLDEGISLVIKPSDRAFDSMNKFVRQMHTASGLLEKIPDGISVSEAESKVMEYLKKHIPQRQTAQMGGNTIHMDRRFLAKYMPKVEEYVHYRSVDVSAIKELCLRWFPDVFEAMPQKVGNHRALADAIESIRELTYYRELFFKLKKFDNDQLADAAAKATDAWKNYLP